MFSATAFCRELDARGAGLYTGVPDSIIKNFCNHLFRNPPPGGHVQAANEGGAIGLAAGSYFATGKIPVVYMQNSGLGNAVNPLLSLADAEVYSVPILLLIGWRGEPGAKDEPQHMKQGRVTPALLDAMGIPYGIIGPEWKEAVAALRRAFGILGEISAPCALLIRKDCFEVEPAVPMAAGRGKMTREDAIRILVESSDDRTVFVASTGMGARELYEVRGARGEPHQCDFLNVGAMGHASMIAAGAALRRRSCRVVCLDGDGALLMHMGVMPLIPSLGLDTFVHVLLNNGTHDSVGGQPNVAMRADMSGLARAAGYDHVFDALTGGDVRGALHTAFGAGGTAFLNIAVKEGHRTDMGRPSVPLIEAAGQFQEFLRFSRDNGK